MNALKLPKKKDSTTYFPFYYTFLGSTEEKIVSTFKGANTKAVFGYLNLNLEEANIENNSTLRVLSMWGETEILVPENVEVITTNTNIFGGTENGHKKTNSKGKKKTLYIESTSVFGSTKIK
jgi:predicted membrane protein